MCLPASRDRDRGFWEPQPPTTGTQYDCHVRVVGPNLWGWGSQSFLEVTKTRELLYHKVVRNLRKQAIFSVLRAF